MCVERVYNMFVKVFNNDGTFRGHTIKTKSGEYSEFEETHSLKKKTQGKHYVEGTEMFERELVDFCLNCTKPACPYGNCDDYEMVKLKWKLNKEDPTE